MLRWNLCPCLSWCGLQATAAIIGIRWKNRMMSTKYGSGTFLRSTTSQNTQVPWLNVQPTRPAAINPQNQRSRPGLIMAFATMMPPATSIATKTKMSENAVSPALRCAARHTAANASETPPAVANQRKRPNPPILVYFIDENRPWRSASGSPKLLSSYFKERSSSGPAGETNGISIC